MVVINVNFINDNINVNLLNAVINEIYINAVMYAVINVVINGVTCVLMYLQFQDSTWTINIGIHLRTQTHWTPLMDTIYAVINGIN
jgi:hypothetical protein